MSFTDLFPCYLSSIVVLSLFSAGNFYLRHCYMVAVFIVCRTYPFLLELNTWMIWVLENFFFIFKNILRAVCAS
jgi:hypothetical protein